MSPRALRYSRAIGSVVPVCVAGTRSLALVLAASIACIRAKSNVLS